MPGITDELARELRERITAIENTNAEHRTSVETLIDERISDVRLIEMINTCLSGLEDDHEFVRKLRFGDSSGDDAKLVGTRYARWGLSLGDVEFLYDLQNACRGLRQPSGRIHPGPSEELENTFRAISEAMYLPEAQVREMDRAAIDELFPRVPLILEKAEGRRSRGEHRLVHAYQRAMDTAESGFGLQLVGAQYVGELWEAARTASRLFSLIDTFEMMHPTAYLPVEVDIPELLFVAEKTGPTDSDYTTVKTGSQRVQVDAKKFLIHQIWSGEMEEDSIVPFLPFLRRQAGLSMAHFSDSLVLNGDTTNAATGNINLDDADPADTKHYLAWDGIRHVGLVDNTANQKDVAGAVSYGLLTGSKGRMIDTTGTRVQDWGHPSDMNDLVAVADPETADRLALMDEVITVDKYGPQATVLTGELARWSVHPVISSIAMSKTEADGKVSTTAANNTKGQIAVFNRRGYKWGWRRRVMVETERLPGRDQTRIVWSMRAGFGRYSPTGAAAAIEHADILFNITL